MAKELPYFKFEPSLWENGNIQLCSFEAQGVFISVCSMYWQRLGDLPYKLALMKVCRGSDVLLEELITSGVLKTERENIIISFLDDQLEEFKIISNKRSEAGRKGGENRVLAPEIARVRGDQLYVIHCYDEVEEFIKIGITSDSISRRFSGKLPYDYDVLLQLSTKDYLNLETSCQELLSVSHSYKPKKNFVGYLECFEMSVFSELRNIIKHRTGNVIAMPKQRLTIREDKKRKEEKKEDENVAVPASHTFEEREKDFMQLLSPHLPEYGKEMLRAFFDYWTERNSNGKKMRFEMQKVFDINKRLATWKRNDKKISNGTTKREQNINDLRVDFAERASQPD